MKAELFLQRLQQNKGKVSAAAAISFGIIYYLKKYHNQFLQELINKNKNKNGRKEHVDSRIINLSILTSSSTLLWLLSVIIEDVSIVDSFWSLGFGLSSIVYYKKTSNPPNYLQENKVKKEEKKFTSKLIEILQNRQKRIVLMTCIWAVRLSSYLTWRNFNLPEDYRYAAMRKGMGSKFWLKSYYIVFLFQTLLCFIISQPLRTIQTTIFPTKFTKFDLVGSLIWIIGFLFETIADFQLAKFKGNPANRGKVLNSGLWKYSRHPNYFGNACMFWGIWIISCAVRNGWKHVSSPILMNYLLLKVSGVPLLESSLSKRKAGYSHYIQSTSSFFPWIKQ